MICYFYERYKTRLHIHRPVTYDDNWDRIVHSARILGPIELNETERRECEAELNDLNMFIVELLLKGEQ